MTQPIAAGFPDWARRDNVTDAMYQATNDVIGAPVTYGPYYVGDVTHLGIFLSVAANDCRFDFRYYLEEGLINQLGASAIVLSDLGTCSVSVPVRGPWLTVSAFPGGVGTLAVIKVWSTGSNAFDMLLGATSNVVFAIDGTAIGAGATINFDSPEAHPGPAYFMCHLEAGVSWRARLYSRNFGVNTLLDYTTNLALTPASKQLYLPPTPLRLTITNLDGVAHNFYASLAAPPLYVS